MRAEQGEPARSGLPAPYEDPWRRLLRDLEAAWAASGLKLRELARLNGEGQLARPGFWPPRLAALFWPLLLALALAALLAIGWAVARAVGSGAKPALLPPQAVRPPSGVSARPPSAPSASPQSDLDPAPQQAPLSPAIPQGREPAGSSAPGASAGPPIAAGPAVAPGPLFGPLSLDGGTPPDSLSPPEPPTPPSPPGPAPLLPKLVGGDPPAWVLGLEERPAASLLRLRLAPGFTALPGAQRRALAEEWFQRGQELGWASLELLDGAGGLLARPARVGSGMILLNSGATPP